MKKDVKHHRFEQYDWRINKKPKLLVDTLLFLNEKKRHFHIPRW